MWTNIKSHQTKWWSLVALLYIVHRSETLTSSWTFYRDMHHFVMCQTSNLWHSQKSRRQLSANGSVFETRGLGFSSTFWTPPQCEGFPHHLSSLEESLSPDIPSCPTAHFLSSMLVLDPPISRVVVPDSSIISTLERNFALVLTNLIHPDRSLSLKLRQ